MDRKKLITAAAMLVGAVVIVIAVMSDDQGMTGVSGTMASPDTVAGVQPATRYRAPQITQNDLQLDDPTFVQLMQNESFREIVQSGDMALIAAIDELSRTAKLNLVAELARTDALDDVPGVVKDEEWGNVSALAAEIPLDELSDAAQDGTLSAIAEIIRDERGFSPFEALLIEDDIVKIVNLAKDRPEGEDYSAFDVIEEIFEQGKDEEFQELAEAIPDGESGPDAPRDEDWIKRKVADGFGRTELADRVEGLYRAGYLDHARDLYRTGFMERTEALFRAGYLDNVGKMARTEFARTAMERTEMARTAMERTEMARTAMERTESQLSLVGRLFRTEGNLELVARLARTPGALERTIAYAESDRFKLVASLERVSAAEAVGELARTGYLEKVDQFARTEGFARMGELADAGKLWRVAEMAENGDLARTIADY